MKQENMIEALENITPSISLEELRRYEELRDKFSASNWNYYKLLKLFYN